MSTCVDKPALWYIHLWNAWYVFLSLRPLRLRNLHFCVLQGAGVLIKHRFLHCCGRFGTKPVGEGLVPLCSAAAPSQEPWWIRQQNRYRHYETYGVQQARLAKIQAFMDGVYVSGTYHGIQTVKPEFDQLLGWDRRYEETCTHSSQIYFTAAITYSITL